MENKILLDNKEVKYKISKSKRARRMRLAVYCDGNFVVTAPHNFGENLVENFIKKNAGWIINKLKYFSAGGKKIILPGGKSDYFIKKNEAHGFTARKLDNFNKIYKFKYNKISIRNQKTRWGSCSRKGNLNFNYKIIMLPEKIAEYIIVHEICHLKEFNHSKDFWRLVENYIADYKEARKELRKYYF
jgi:hypothetical protein